MKLEEVGAAGDVELSFPLMRCLHNFAPMQLTWLGMLLAALGIFFSIEVSPYFMFATAIGALVLVQGLSGWLGKVRIRIRSGRLEVTTPYWMGRRKRLGAEVEQLFVFEHPLAVEKQNAIGLEVGYGVKAILVGGREVVLLDTMRSPIDALFIEQELERRLGIDDARVAHEYERPRRGALADGIGSNRAVDKG